MSLDKHRSLSGLGTLEFAIALIVLCGFIGGGFAITAMMHDKLILGEVMQAELRADAIRPFRLISNDLGVAHTEIEAYLIEAADRIKASLMEKGYPEDNFLIEIAYAELLIDPRNGNSLGLRNSPFTRRFSVGVYSPSAESLEQANLGANFIGYSAHRSEGSSRSPYAVVNSLLDSPDDQYLASTILVGSRSILKLNGMPANVLSWLGGTDEVVDMKMILLRGEVA